MSEEQLIIRQTERVMLVIAEHYTPEQTRAMTDDEYQSVARSIVADLFPVPDE